MKAYVTYEQAMLMKELGYGLYEETDHFYCIKDDTLLLYHIDELKVPYLYVALTTGHINDEFVLAPTIQQAADWLRGKGLYTYPDLNALRMWFAKVLDMKKMDELLFDGEMFDTYEEALSHGVDYCLSVLIYKKDEKIQARNND